MWTINLADVVNRMPFYEVQLILLATLCVLFLLYERWAALRRSSDTDDAKGGPLENSPVSSLAKQYLIVYAIVMGMSSIPTTHFGDALTNHPRRRLASRSLHLFPL
jgi:hypothetical protein